MHKKLPLVAAKRRCALIFPPLWYFTSVPADLSYAAGYLRGRGIHTQCWDLSAGLNHQLLGHTTGFKALQDPATYSELSSVQTAHKNLYNHTKEISKTYGIRYRFREFSFPDIDRSHTPSVYKVGLDGQRNPALPYLRRVVDEAIAFSPHLIAIACVHPDQLNFLPILGRLCRQAGYSDLLVLYGALEDVLSPEDLADDLIGLPRHVLFDDFDGAIIGDAESALKALSESDPSGDLSHIPNFIWRQKPEVRPPKHIEDLGKISVPDFSWVQPSHYAYPKPVVDLRLGRGCPWGKCAFCAIQAHQPGYRAGPVTHVLEAMTSAHSLFGTTYFRIRDDLITPVQLRQLAKGIANLPFRARWMIRSRFEPGVTASLLQEAADAGLEEIWMGLESGSPRLRDLMDKGVKQEVVVRILGDAKDVGIRIRALCIIGFPGETVASIKETVDFLEMHRDQLAMFSLTPFQLMRNSPMSSNPEHYGLIPTLDLLPRHERLRHQIPTETEGIMSFAEIRIHYQEVIQHFSDIATKVGGPDPTHDWILASTIKKPTP